MRRTVATRIDEGLCDGCGICEAVCPNHTLTVIDGKARVTGAFSSRCAHCAAVCPTGAIRVEGIEPAEDVSGAPHQGVSDLVRLMATRRSCRAYLSAPVPLDVLERLVRIGMTAPSGTNSQRWTFTLLPNRAAVERLGDGVAAFYTRLNRMASSRLMRTVSRLLAKDALGRYHREYQQEVEEALGEWERERRDRLFHGAPAVIIIGMRPGASCPCEDGAMASQNILLAAHAMGYGTCMVGFAVAAFDRRPGLKQLVGIPEEEAITSVIALGTPAVRYLRPAGRMPAPVRIAR